MIVLSKATTNMDRPRVRMMVNSFRPVGYSGEVDLNAPELVVCLA